MKGANKLSMTTCSSTVPLTKLTSVVHMQTFTQDLAISTSTLTTRIYQLKSFITTILMFV